MDVTVSTIADLREAATEVPPGSTINLAGGDYPVTSEFAPLAAGLGAYPVTIQSKAGELARLVDTRAESGYTVRLGAESFVLRDVAVVNTNTDRSVERPTGIDLTGRYAKAVNCAVLDAGVSYTSQAGGPGAEIYGCLSLNQGWELDPDIRGSGHAMYVANATGVLKRFRHNIFGPGYGYGIHAYSHSGGLDDMEFEGIVSALAGLLANETAAGGFPNTHYADLIGGLNVPANRVVVRRHYGYQNSLDLDYNTVPPNTYLTIDGGRIDAGSVLDIDTWEPSSILAAILESPGTQAVVVELNACERGRANIIVFNPALANTVAVDLSTVLANGDIYGIFDGWNPLASPLTTGTYAGGSVTVTMPTVYAIPAGGWRWAAAPTRSKAFGVFVVRKMTSWVAPTDADRIAPA